MSDQHWEYLAFGGYKSSDYGVWISGEGSFAAPERDVSVFEVPGKNGTLTIDNGRWKNVQITYPCFMSGNFLEDFGTFKSVFLKQTGYKNLRDTYHPDGYRNARLVGGIKPKTGPYNRSAEFNLTFDCWPQFYLDSGTSGVSFTEAGTLSDIPAVSYSRPTVTIILPTIQEVQATNRTGSVTIGGRTISFSNLAYAGPTYPLKVNCEKRTITYYEGVSVADKFTLNDGDFWEITPPSVEVSFSGHVKNVIIQPKWWTL